MAFRGRADRTRRSLSRTEAVLMSVGLVVGACVPESEKSSPWSPSTPTTALPQTTTTALPQTTTTTSRVPETPTVLWSGSRVDDWVSTAITGRAYVEDVVHPLLGPAVRLVNEEVDGTHNAAARINWEGFDPDYVMPTEAWYSVTVLVPYFVDGQNNVFQFKQRNGDTDEHLWNLGWRPVDGVLRFIVRSRLEGSTWVSGRPSEVAVLETEVPIGTPFRIDVFRRMSVEDDGRYEVLVNGETVWAFDGATIADNLDTPVRKGHHWAMSHYFGDWQGVVEPRTSHIFITDAAITTTPPESYEAEPEGDSSEYAG